MTEKNIQKYGKSSDFATTEHVGYFSPTNDAIRNFGMGFMMYGYSDHMFIPNDESGPTLELDRATFDTAANLPHADHIYLRYEWKDIQKEPGKLDLPDSWLWAMDAIEKQKKGWSFRIMPSMPHTNAPYSIPAFLEDKIELAHYTRKGYDKYTPAYCDEYLKWWKEMLHLLADKFDGHPYLESVDVSGFGYWGEWHQSKSTLAISPEREAYVKQRLVDDHLEAFQKTAAVIGAIPTRDGHTDDLFISATERGCWMRRDSFSPDYTKWEYDVSRGSRQEGTGYVYELALHPDSAYKLHPNSLHKESVTTEMTYPKMFQHLLDVGSSHLQMGFNPWHAIITHKEFPDTLEHINAKIGFRIRPSWVSLKRVTRHEPKWLQLALVNDGSCGPTGVLTVTAQANDGTEASIELPAGHPQPGRLEIHDIPLPDDYTNFSDDAYFTLQLSLKIKEKTFPIRWAVPAEEAHDQERFILKISSPPAFE